MGEQHGLWHDNTLQILGLDVGNSLSISQQGRMYLPNWSLLKPLPDKIIPRMGFLVLHLSPLKGCSVCSTWSAPFTPYQSRGGEGSLI